MPGSVKKFVPATTSTDGLADKRQVLVNCSADGVDRQGDIVVQAGIDTSSFMKTGGTVLWQHDPDQPIAKAIDIGLDGGQLRSLVQFPKEGASAKADEIYNLIREGVVNATSIGFAPVKWEPIDPKEPWSGRKYTQIDLMEFSFVSVPAMPDATIIARSASGEKDEDAAFKCGASRNLPIGDDKAWDGASAAQSIFDHAGFDGDSPDFGFVRKGFLAYDAANPKLKGSYKEPFAAIVEGRLTAMPAGIRAAASRLPQTDIPDDVKTKAKAVLDHYEAKMKDKGSRAPAAKFGAIKVKGLYEVAYLAQLLVNLGYLHSDSVREAEIEGDNSKVPAMLADALQRLAAAFLAMSAEETHELLAGHDVEIEDDDAQVASAPTAQTKAWRSALLKAGRALSAENVEHVKAMQKCIAAMMDCRTKALDSHGETHEQLQAFADQLNLASNHAKAMLKANKKKPSAEDGDEGEGADNAGEPDDGDDDADVELAALAARRKRVLEMTTL